MAWYLVKQRELHLYLRKFVRIKYMSSLASGGT
jgi:hypothetical protein